LELSGICELMRAWIYKCHALGRRKKTEFHKSP
jgi:hypothetical protein